MNPILAPVDSFITDLESQLSVAQSDRDAAKASLVSAQTQLFSLQNVSVFSNLELSPWKVASGAAGDTGATGSLADDSQSVPTSSCAFLAIAPNGPYANKYFYKTNGADPTKDTFIYDLRLMLPDPAAPQAVELDIQQCIGGICYNTGAQWDFAENLFRIWNRNGHAWVATGLLSPRWAANTWQHIVLETHRDAANVFYDAITINGTRAPLTQFSFPAPTLGLTDMLNNAIQIDGDKAGLPYKLFIDAVNFTAK